MSQTNKRRHRFVILGSIGCVFAGGILVLAGVWNDDAGPTIDPENPQQVALGQSVYSKNCASCHGANLQGQPDWQIRNSNGRLPAPPHDRTGHTWHHADDVLFGITKMGIADYALPDYESDMPIFGDTLTDEEIWAALTYITSRWPADIKAKRTARNKRQS